MSKKLISPLPDIGAVIKLNCNSWLCFLAAKTTFSKFILPIPNFPIYFGFDPSILSVLFKTKFIKSLLLKLGANDFANAKAPEITGVDTDVPDQ